jgi:hypothetical protein
MKSRLRVLRQNDCIEGNLRTQGFTHIGDHTTERRSQMTRLRTLSAFIFLSTAVATPAFAQDTGAQAARTQHGRDHALQKYRGVYNQLNGPLYAIPSTPDRRNIGSFGFSGRDPSRVGGEDADLNPSGN